MATALAETPEFMTWTWEDIEPRYRELEGRSLIREDIGDFLQEWSELADQIGELASRLKVATDVNTADDEASARYRTFVQETSPRIEEAENRLTRKLLGSGFVPEGMEVPFRRMAVDVELFREENLPLLAEERLLHEEYSKISGAQTVEWDGREIPIAQLLPVMEEQDRERREQAWRTGAERRLQDREAIAEVWKKLLEVRAQMATNAGFADYRSYRWLDLKRFDYTPDDALELHRTVERLMVPAVTRMMERRKERLRIPSVRPWDRAVDVFGRPPLHPYDGAAELESTTQTIFEQVDPVLAEYFATMRREGLLDLENRKHKAPGAYCTSFPAKQRPFILGNATGINDDVFTLFHESGHAFHVFETEHLPYAHQKSFGAIPMEFAEVASMGMELLAAPYLSKDEGGFYSRADAARVRLDHLSVILTLFPWISAIDSFQHWVYEHPADAGDVNRADEVWAGLMARFMPFVDWSGLEAAMRNDWQRIPHLFGWPFYFLEYGLAQLGALQVWVNAQRDQGEAVSQYRHALSLGGTRSLPELFEAAGARFAFDEATIRDTVDLLESSIDELDREQERGLA